jgi:hypothetical protein
MILLAGLPLLAQPGEPVSEPRTFDQESWEQATEGMDYSEAPTGTDQTKPTTIRTIPPTGQIIGFIVIAALLGWLVYLLVRRMAGAPNARASDRKFTLDDLDQGLPDADLDTLLVEALAAGNHRLALRLQYLMVIQALHLGGHIHWQPDRTNSAYLRDTSGQPWHTAFRQATRWYEVAWYGDSTVPEAAYHRLAPHFSRLLHEVAHPESKNRAA